MISIKSMIQVQVKAVGKVLAQHIPPAANHKTENRARPHTCRGDCVTQTELYSREGHGGGCIVRCIS